MRGLIVNVDVPDLAAGEAFYVAAFGLSVRRRTPGFIELDGGPVPLCLILKHAATRSDPAGSDTRRYGRHWTPVHLDMVVDDIHAAAARALAAGAIREGEPADTAFGRIALFADPFGHGFCLIEFNARGYDALTG